MRIGFCGAHRTGKSTLARLVSEEFGLPLVASGTSAIVAKHGFDMAKDNRLETGMAMQSDVLHTLVSALRGVAYIGKPTYVSDRTPIDVAAYVMADATAGAGTAEAREEAMQLVDNALRATERLFDIVILLPPAITFEAVDGKPPFNDAYQEHHHLLCRGMLFDEDLDVYWDEIKRVTHSIDARMDFVRETIAAFTADQALAA